MTGENIIKPLDQQDILSDPDIRGGYVPGKYCECRIRECRAIVSIGKRGIGSRWVVIDKEKSKIP